MTRRKPPQSAADRRSGQAPPRRWVWFLCGFSGAALLAFLLLFDPADFQRHGEAGPDNADGLLPEPIESGRVPGVERDRLRAGAPRVPAPEPPPEALQGPRGRPADLVVSLRSVPGGLVVELDDDALPGSDPAALWALLTVHIRSAIRTAPPEEAEEFRVAVRAGDDVPWTSLVSAMDAAARAGATEAELIGGGEAHWDDDELDLELGMEGVIISLERWGRRAEESR